MRTIRTVVASSMVAAVLAVAGCSGLGPTATSCTTDDACGASGRCLARTCVADGSPVASIAVPLAITTNRLVLFDGGASADPDPNDAIRSYAWTFAPDAAPCAPPVVADTGPVARVRFACAGRYSVSLVVRDEKGVASPPAVEAFDVGVSTDAPMLTAGADLALGHSCSDGRCTPAGDVALAATTTGAFLGPVTYHWTVEPPPDRALGPTRRLAFSPSADVPNPSVALESDDAALSGDWVFRVEARDAAGVIGTAVTRVSVTNRPPVVTADKLAPVPHVFDAASSRLTASGRVGSVTVTDPDGDPIPVRVVSWVHANDGGGVFEGEDLGSEVTFRVAVDYASPADAGFLIDGPALERAVRIAATDVNGGETVETRAVEISNRPPVLADPAPVQVQVDHSFDAAQGQYRATATLGRWSDPDGDPIWQADPTGDADCSALSLLVDGTSVAICSRAYAGVPAVHLFAGDHVVRSSVRDPWAIAAERPDVIVQIHDRAPVVTNTSGTAPVACTPDEVLCCREAPNGSCLVSPTATTATAFTFAPAVSDPDGDPVEVRFPLGVTPASVVCVAGACPAATAELAAMSTCGTEKPTATISFVASDGASSASGTHTETGSCVAASR
ncbi:PKD domain-containing protein [Anaeromyxobacter oryzae]|uniref:PKD domain-containing protein n=1 Tax=Anaeromyxobacter oryzae TaxID=2918170 RepID=A0ABM7WVA6_9BACT|nr:PKD domain-containing protein [Anaeromyxobacter oryzae]BDG03335.1 hypothetical protein AMOR_23310 [Anaeromyxobacter oryzae]